MGSGKTTISQLLAAELGYQFIDTDAEIEKEYNATCQSIIKRYGIKDFRDKEQKLLIRLTNTEIRDTIISTGGGMSCNESNLQKMRQCGTIIYLKWTAANLTTRLMLTDLSKRPLLSNLQPSEMEQKIKNDLFLRETFYSQADIIIDCPINSKPCTENDDYEIAQYIVKQIKTKV